MYNKNSSVKVMYRMKKIIMLMCRNEFTGVYGSTTMVQEVVKLDVFDLSCGEINDDSVRTDAVLEY